MIIDKNNQTGTNNGDLLNLQHETAIIQIGKEINNEEIEYYISDSKLVVKDILFQNTQNRFSSKDIHKLYELANLYKNNGEYEKANELFGILLDYSIHNMNSGIKRVYETDNCYNEVFEADYNYFFDLAVLIFEGKYLNIPIPLLSKEAVKIFFTRGVNIIDKKEHCRSVSKKDEEVKILNERYELLNTNKAPWLLKNDNKFHSYIEDLI